MEGVPALREIIEKNDFICKLDLKDAYVVTPIHPNSKKYLTFQNKGLIYQHKALTFGMSCSSPFSTAGIPRLRFRYEEHVDSSPSKKDVEAHDSNQTSHKSQTSSIQLLVIHAEGSIFNTQQTPTELECTNDIIGRQQERATMVDKLDGEEEWPANKEISIQPTESNDDICRCIRSGTGIGRDSISNTTRPNSEDTRTVQPIQSQSRIRTYSRTGEYSSGLTEQTAPHNNEKLTLRGPVTEKNISTDQPKMRSINHRCIRGQDEHKTTHILEHAPRSGSNSSRCVPTNVEEVGNVLISTLEVHITNDANNKTTKDPKGGADYAILANPILVPIITTDKTCQQTSDIQDKRMEDDRLVLICNKRKAFGNLEEDTVKSLTHAQRSKTHKNYNAG
ncbi:hypothetical protein G6F56_005301 [Rhizopus delemar]|nr:hypothetical protein G6F56_005301 [Rhizopus delemar]